MKYILLIYTDEAEWSRMTKEEAGKLMGEYGAFTNDVKTSGRYVGGERLQSVTATTTVRVRNGKVSTTDGPYAETKEQLGGYFLIDARDLNEAIQVAGRIPGARAGAIEVRPIAPM